MQNVEVQGTLAFSYPNVYNEKHLKKNEDNSSNKIAGNSTIV